MKFLTYLILLVIFITCQTDKGKSVQKIEVPIKNKINIKKTKIEFVSKNKLIECNQERKDTLIEFHFQNTGNNPLLIRKATSNCGCTITNYPKDSIYPNERNKIQARVNLKYRETNQIMIKQTMIKIFGNFDDSIINLSITSKIFPPK